MYFRTQKEILAPILIFRLMIESGPTSKYDDIKVHWILFGRDIYMAKASLYGRSSHRRLV